MASVIIRNLDEDLKAKLRLQASKNGRSTEEEARDILRCALSAQGPTQQSLAQSLRARVKPFGGVDLVLPER